MVECEFESIWYWAWYPVDPIQTRREVQVLVIAFRSFWILCTSHNITTGCRCISFLDLQMCNRLCLESMRDTDTVNTSQLHRHLDWLRVSFLYETSPNWRPKPERRRQSHPVFSFGVCRTLQRDNEMMTLFHFKRIPSRLYMEPSTASEFE